MTPREELDKRERYDWLTTTYSVIPKVGDEILFIEYDDEFNIVEKHWEKISEVITSGLRGNDKIDYESGFKSNWNKAFLDSYGSVGPKEHVLRRDVFDKAEYKGYVAYGYSEEDVRIAFDGWKKFEVERQFKEIENANKKIEKLQKSVIEKQNYIRTLISKT